jgi:hypothetical protein
MLERTRDSEAIRSIHIDLWRGQSGSFTDDYRQALEVLEPWADGMIYSGWENVRGDDGCEITPSYALDADDIEQIDDPLNLTFPGITVGELHAAYRAAGAAGQLNYFYVTDDEGAKDMWDDDREGIATWLTSKGLTEPSTWCAMALPGLPEDVPPQVVYFPEGHPELALFGRYGH